LIQFKKLILQIFGGLGKGLFEEFNLDGLEVPVGVLRDRKITSKIVGWTENTGEAFGGFGHGGDGLRIHN